MTMTWGLCGPDHVGSERRTRTLDIGSAVREYNERAVPGMGAVWYAKQLLLATLGVALAQALRRHGMTHSNIAVANAIEALGCYFALTHDNGQGDSRVRGSEKLRGKAGFDFKTLCKPGFYVSQPMRMGSGQALLALGLVRAQGERFNAFACTDFGGEFINACCEDDGVLLETLVQWALKGRAVSDLKPGVRQLLSPLHGLPAAARALLSRRIDSGAGGGERRVAIRRWLAARHAEPAEAFDWRLRPDAIDPEHWNDLHYGALFFQVQDAAYDVLNALEQHLAVLSTLRFRLGSVLPERIATRLDHLRQLARLFLENPMAHRKITVAEAFCRECADPDDASLLTHLVRRDDRVLRLRGREVVPGPAFLHQGAPIDGDQVTDEVTEAPAHVALPAWISHRVERLRRLDLDLQGLAQASTSTNPSTAIEEVNP